MEFDLKVFHNKIVRFGGVFDSDHTYVKLDGGYYKFTHNESDGYRSYCSSVEKVRRPRASNFSLDNQEVNLWAKVDVGNFRGIQLYFGGSEDSDGILIAEFETDNSLTLLSPDNKGIATITFDISPDFVTI